MGYPYADIAAVLDRGEPAVRQLAGRARKHVEERRPRYEVDPAERRDLTERFLAAAAGGDLEGLMALLAPDVRLIGDSGGLSKAPLRVIETADKVGRFLYAVAQQGVPDPSYRSLELNGGAALLVLSGGKPDSTVQLDVVDGRIDHLRRPQSREAGVPGQPVATALPSCPSKPPSSGRGYRRCAAATSPRTPCERCAAERSADAASDHQ